MNPRWKSCPFCGCRYEDEAESLRAELMRARAELNRMHQAAQDQSDEVQELWLSPCEAEGLKRQLARREIQVASIREAIAWLWGYYDGNTLVAKPGYEDDIRDAWDKLLESVESPGAAKMLELVERLKRERDEWCRVAQQERAWMRREQSKLSATEAALANCGLTGIYDDFSSPADAIEQMVERLIQLEGGQALQNERQLRQEAEKHRADARLTQHALELKVGLERQSAYTERALRQEAEQRAERAEELERERDEWRGDWESVTAKLLKAEALAALVTPELARLLEQMAS